MLVPVAVAVLFLTAGASLGSGEIDRDRAGSFLTFRAGPPETATTTTTTTTPTTAAVLPTPPAPPTTPSPPRVPRPTTTTPPPTPSTLAVAVARESSYSPPVVGRLIIPAIGLDTTVYDGGDLAQIDHGPSHFPGTAYPGKQGNTVFAGHRVTRTHPFRDLDLLGPGDTLTFVVPSGTYTYEWTGQRIVHETQGAEVVAQPEAYTATLFACHPKGSDQYRIVTSWRLLDPPPVVTGKTPSGPKSIGTLPGR